jgi:hypothetical protein
MRNAAESAARRMGQDGWAMIVVLALLVVGLAALAAFTRPDETPPRPIPDCRATPIYLTATIAPGKPTPRPGTPWPTVVSYALCA